MIDKARQSLHWLVGHVQFCYRHNDWLANRRGYESHVVIGWLLGDSVTMGSGPLSVVMGWATKPRSSINTNVMNTKFIDRASMFITLSNCDC